MPKHVQLPDGTVGEFPDNMDDSAIEAVLRKQFPPQQAPSLMSNPRAFLAQRVSDLQNEAQRQQNLYLGPEGQATTANATGVLGKAGSYLTRFGHGVASLAPETAAMADKALLAASEWKNAIPIALGAVDPAIPAAYFGAQGTLQAKPTAQAAINNPSPENVQNALSNASMIAGAAGGARSVAPSLLNRTQSVPSVQQFLNNKAKDIYQQVLKPSLAKSAPPAEQLVGTGLKEGIPISPAGAEKIAALIDDINNQVSSKISNSGATVNKWDVVGGKGSGGLNKTYKDFATQVSPTSDIKAIAEVGNDFLASHPDVMSAPYAQDLKVGTYRQLKGKYGEQGAASVEAQKAIAHEIRNELGNQIPELNGLNAREGSLIELQPAIDRAVARAGNRGFFSLGSAMLTGAVKGVTGSGKIGVAAGVMKAVLDDPTVASKLAIAMYNNSNGRLSLPAAQSRVRAYAASLGSAAVGASANNGAPGDQSSQ